MSAVAIKASEVTDVLRRIARGDIEVRLQEGAPNWADTYAGEVFFQADGWKFAIFNDCDSIDYVDSATAPDGRTSEFNDWWSDSTDPEGHGENPSDSLRDDRVLYERLVAAR